MDVHQEAHAGRHHHRLRLRSGLHAAGGHRVLDTRLENAATGHISPGLPAHLLHMVVKFNPSVRSTVYSYIYRVREWPLCHPHSWHFVLFLCPLFVLSLVSLVFLHALPVSCQGGSSVCQMVAGQQQKGGSHRAPPQGSACERPGLTSRHTGVSQEHFTPYYTLMLSKLLKCIFLSAVC